MEILVDLLPKQTMSAPRVESPTHLMAMGLGTSLDDAMRNATSSMIDWLINRYGLSFSDMWVQHLDKMGSQGLGDPPRAELAPPVLQH